MDYLCLFSMKKQFYNNYRFLLFVIVLLFSLTPCKVKASWFDAVGATYEQTLNQSKVAANCSNSFFSIHKVNPAKAFAITSPSNFVFKSVFYSEEKKNSCVFLISKTVWLQLPPKYILYKQLKFDLV